MSSKARLIAVAAILGHPALIHNSVLNELPSSACLTKLYCVVSGVTLVSLNRLGLQFIYVLLKTSD
jgi:hypothetical protein